MAMMGNRYHVVGTGEVAPYSRTLNGVRQTKHYLRTVRNSLRAAGEEVIGGSSSGYRVNGLHRLYVVKCGGFGCEECRAVPPEAVEQASRVKPSAHPRWHDRRWLRANGIRC